jgi:hypothetical protein
LTSLKDVLSQNNIQFKITEKRAVKIGDVFKGFGGETSKLQNLTLEYQIEIEQLTDDLAKAEQQFEIFTQKAGDATRPLEERQQFADLANKKSIAAAKIRNDINNKELELTRRLVLERIKLATGLDETTLIDKNANTELEKSISLLDKFKQKVGDGFISGKISQEEADRFVEAIRKSIEDTTLAQQQSLQSQTEAIQNLQDLLEFELDVRIDGFDKIKTLNEQLINDDTITTERRAELLIETEKLFKSNFSLQIKAIEDFQKKRLKRLAGDDKALLKAAQDFKIDEDFILSFDDPTALKNYINQLGLAEVISLRLFEATREVNQGVKDFQINTKDLAADVTEQNFLESQLASQRVILKNLESNRKTLQSLVDADDINKAIIKNKKDTEKELKKLSDESLQNEIDDLKIKIQNVEDDSLEQVRLKVSLGEKLIQQERNLNDAIVEDKEKTNKELEKLDNEKQEAEEQAIQDRLRLIQAAAKIANQLNEKIAQDQIERIDNSIEGLEDRQAILTELAVRGVEDSVDNLAFAQKKKAELEAEAARVDAQKIRREFGLLTLETFGSRLNAGEKPKEAIAGTITDIAFLTAFINSLPSYFDGVDDTGKVNDSLDKNGGRLSILHDNERVLTKKQNSDIGSISNDKVVDLVHKGRNFEMMQQYNSKKEMMKTNEQLVEINNNIKTLTNKPVYLGSDYDAIEKAIVSKINEGNSNIKTYKKTGGAFFRKR